MRPPQWVSPYVRAVFRALGLVGTHENSWLATPTEIDAGDVAATAIPELKAPVDPPLWQYF